MSKGSAGQPRRKKLAVDRFWSKVNKTSYCWEWLAGLDKDGYGKFNPRAGVCMGAHKFSCEIANGPVQPGFDVHHECENKRCVNPAHLKALPKAAHASITPRPMAGTRLVSQCRQGHDFTPENTYLHPSGKRHCRTCQRERTRKKAV